jgi:hypothetical protein
VRFERDTRRPGHRAADHEGDHDRAARSPILHALEVAVRAAAAGRLELPAEAVLRSVVEATVALPDAEAA